MTTDKPKGEVMDVAHAELEIAKVLAQLERDMDCLIDSVEIHSIDVTGIDSVRQEVKKSVHLNVRRIGHDWYTGE